jgi:hypothetical protein
LSGAQAIRPAETYMEIGKANGDKSLIKSLTLLASNVARLLNNAKETKRLMESGMFDSVGFEVITLEEVLASKVSK